MEQLTGNFKMYTLARAIIFTVMLSCSGFSAYALKQQYTPDEELMYRINFGSATDVKLLLDGGANPNAISKTGEYAISVAIGRDDAEAVEIVRLLLDKGANPNVFDRSSTYPIVSAATNNETKMVEYLIAKGADFHAKSVNGRPLIEIAKANNNTELVAIFQKAMDEEAAFIASLHTPERFMELIHKYISSSCQYQYWNFVLGSQQMLEKEVEVEEKAKRAENDITSYIEQIQKYYPTTPSSDLQKIANSASQKIFDILDAMISNNNRAKNGVGTLADADGRCKKISDDIKIEFPPSVYK